MATSMYWLQKEEEKKTMPVIQDGDSAEFKDSKRQSNRIVEATHVRTKDNQLLSSQNKRPTTCVCI